MIKKYLILMTIPILVVASSCKPVKHNPPTDEMDKRVAEVLSKLTLEEKVGQMTQIALTVVSVGDTIEVNPEPAALDMEKLKTAISKYKVGSILNTVNNRARTKEWWNEQITVMQELSLNEIGVPLLYGIDAIHGTTYTAGGTLFPQQINQGATFNPELVKKLNEVCAYEMRASNIPWNFSPVLDMGRDARDPRLWERYGEDVYLCSVMGVAAVEGLQGENARIIDMNHAAACLKHYLGYNSNSGKDRNPLSIHPRELKEIHAPAFQAAIDAGAKSVMINSGLLNGIPVHASHDILTTLLREEMGFKGLVVTDWADIENLHNRDKYASSQKEAVKLAINAGIDMSMVPYNFNFCQYLIELVNEGEVPMSRIDEAVGRVLKLKMELGLFEHPNTSYQDYPDFGSQQSASLSLETAIESITLLKNNDNILPLDKNVKVLVSGPNSNSMRTMNGGWSYSWQGEKTEEFASGYNTFLEAIQNKIGASNVKYVEGVSYNMNGKYYEETNIDIASAVKAAQAVDFIILFLGENSYTEKPGDLHDLYISENQAQLALSLAKTGKPVVLVMNEGRPRIISAFEEQMAAVVQTYLPSNYGGDALADILFGDANPSGKLPYTYPMFPNSLITYDYKYSEKQEKLAGQYNYESDVAIQYEFGHGLSYTTFEYSDFKVSSNKVPVDGNIQVSVRVTNTGELAGKEVVFLFSSDLYASIAPENKRLRRFEKINLEPSESKTVEFEISARDLAFYGQNLQLMAEAGDFVLSINGLKQTVSLEKTITFEQVSKLNL